MSSPPSSDMDEVELLSSRSSSRATKSAMSRRVKGRTRGYTPLWTRPPFIQLAGCVRKAVRCAASRSPGDRASKHSTSLYLKYCLSFATSAFGPG